MFASDDIDFLGFVIGIFKDPFGRWTANLSPTASTHHFYKILNAEGETVIHGSDRDLVIEKAKQIIRRILES